MKRKLTVGSINTIQDDGHCGAQQEDDRYIDEALEYQENSNCSDVNNDSVNHLMSSGRGCWLDEMTNYQTEIQENLLE